jgi:hypothetical protein
LELIVDFDPSAWSQVPILGVGLMEYAQKAENLMWAPRRVYMANRHVIRLFYEEPVVRRFSRESPFVVVKFPEKPCDVCGHQKCDDLFFIEIESIRNYVFGPWSCQMCEPCQRRLGWTRKGMLFVTLRS